MAKNEEMKTEFEVFKDVWNVYKKFYFVTDNNEFWDELVNECGKVRDKYHIALLHRSKSIVASIKADSAFKGVFGEAIRRNRQMTPSSVQIDHHKVHHLNMFFFHKAFCFH